jgi:G3E family GTPase
MAAGSKLDAIVIECSGIAEPRQIAAAFEEDWLKKGGKPATATVAASPEVGGIDAAVPKARSEAYRLATTADGGGSAPTSTDATVVDLLVPTQGGQNGRLDTLVTVIDSESFLHHFASEARVGDNADFRKVENADSGDMRHIVDLLIDQVEIADVIIMNKVDLLNDFEELEQLRSIIQMMNPTASAAPSGQCLVPSA